MLISEMKTLIIIKSIIHSILPPPLAMLMQMVVVEVMVEVEITLPVDGVVTAALMVETEVMVRTVVIQITHRVKTEQTVMTVLMA